MERNYVRYILLAPLLSPSLVLFAGRFMKGFSSWRNRISEITVYAACLADLTHRKAADILLRSTVAEVRRDGGLPNSRGSRHILLSLWNIKKTIAESVRC